MKKQVDLDLGPRVVRLTIRRPSYAPLPDKTMQRLAEVIELLTKADYELQKEN